MIYKYFFVLIAALLIGFLILQIMKSIKSKRVKIGILVIIVVYMLIPQRIVRIEPAEVSAIEIFSGYSGEFATVDDREDIEYIIENLKGLSFRKIKLSIGYMGYGFRMTIYDKNGDYHKEFIVNSNSIIRRDPFFYKDSTEGIDYNYIDELLDEMNPDEEPIKQALVYKNENLEFSLELPTDWEERYSVFEDDDVINFYCKSIHDKWEHNGQLFSIIRMTGELVTQEDLDQASMMHEIVLRENGYTYILRLPSDVQYPLNDGELTVEYHDMVDDVNEIVDSIVLFGTQQPKTEKTGYKVVGSSFFTMEIPSNWVLVPEINSLYWTIEEDSKHIGSIQFMSYADERLDSDEDLVHHAYLGDDATKRAVNIFLREKTEMDVMEKIKDSFQFLDGPYNVVDMQTAADTYVSQGGQMFYGTIDGFEMVDGKLNALRINVVEYIEGDPDEPGTPEGKFANGYDIVPSHQITCPVGEVGVSVIPLVGPNFNTYGIYDAIMIDESFIQDFDKRYNRLYKFHIGADGEIKILEEQYLP